MSCTVKQIELTEEELEDVIEVKSENNAGSGVRYYAKIKEPNEWYWISREQYLEFLERKQK